MSESQRLPLSGYFLEKVYTNHQLLEIERPRHGAARDSGQFIFGWDWEIVDDRTFDVRLQLGLDPTSSRWERVRVTLTGRFKVGTESVSVDPTRFVSLQAPAILMPYAREVISALTARGFYGPFYLPSVNVARLMATRSSDDTMGGRQLREGRKLLTGDGGATHDSARKRRSSGRTKPSGRGTSARAKSR